MPNDSLVNESKKSCLNIAKTIVHGNNEPKDLVKSHSRTPAGPAQRMALALPPTALSPVMLDSPSMLHTVLTCSRWRPGQSGEKQVAK